MTLSGANTYTGPTIVSNGTLQVDGSLASGSAVSVNGGTLAGIGTINGLVTNNATLAPGDAGIGTLTISSNITLTASSTNTFDVNGSTPTNDVIVAGGNVTYDGLLNIVPAGTFTVGQQFQLFRGAGATNTSNFASINSSIRGLVFSFTNGVLTVVTGTVGPGARISDEQLQRNHAYLEPGWPAGQGWRLQMQTNSLSIGLSTNWIYITDGSISSTNITVDPTKPTVFYRLRYP